MEDIVLTEKDIQRDFLDVTLPITDCQNWCHGQSKNVSLQEAIGMKIYCN